MSTTAAMTAEEETAIRRFVRTLTAGMTDGEMAALCNRLQPGSALGPRELLALADGDDDHAPRALARDGAAREPARSFRPLAGALPAVP